MLTYILKRRKDNHRQTAAGCANAGFEGGGCVMSEEKKDITREQVEQEVAQLVNALVVRSIEAHEQFARLVWQRADKNETTLEEVRRTTGEPLRFYPGELPSVRTLIDAVKKVLFRKNCRSSKDWRPGTGHNTKAEKSGLPSTVDKTKRKRNPSIRAQGERG